MYARRFRERANVWHLFVFMLYKWIRRRCGWLNIVLKSYQVE
jgi:hypothetical protein